MSLRHVDVALVLPALRGGGVERVFLDLARGLTGKGLRVDLVVAAPEGPLLKQVPPQVGLVDLGVPKRGRLLRSYPYLRRYFQQRRPSWAIPVWGYFDIIPIMAALREDVRVLWILHNTPEYLKDLPPFKREFAIKAMRFALYRSLHWEQKGAMVLGAVSRGVLEAFSQEFALPIRDKPVLPNPVDSDRVCKLAEEVPEHPWPRQGVPYFLAIGRLHAQKGFSLLLEAFARFKKADKRGHKLLILGEGPERPFLTSLRDTLGLSKEVDLPGFVENPYPYFRRAKAFVMTSLYEGFPIVLLEALALGCPVIAVQAKGGVAEALGYGKYGILTPRSPEDLAEAMEHIAAYPFPDDQGRLQHLERHRLEKVVEVYLHHLNLGA